MRIYCFNSVHLNPLCESITFHLRKFQMQNDRVNCVYATHASIQYIQYLLFYMYFNNNVILAPYENCTGYSLIRYTTCTHIYTYTTRTLYILIYVVYIQFENVLDAWSFTQFQNTIISHPKQLNKRQKKRTCTNWYAVASDAQLQCITNCPVRIGLGCIRSIPY